MALYTFIMEYKGRTYTSQANAASPKNACFKWAKELKAREIFAFGEKSKEILVEQMKSEKPVLLGGLKNTWCVSASIRGELALINFVRTDKETDNRQPTTDN